MRTRNSRTKSGQCILVLGLIISVFLVLSIGLFSFEINRLGVAREQLRAVCDAAGLAAAAALASSDELDPLTTQTAAIDTALSIFQQNAIVGIPLTEASTTENASDRPGPNQCLLYCEFLDPHNSHQPVSLGDPSGKVIRVTGLFGMVPAFGVFLGLGSVPIRAISAGGVPTLDVAICFDVSASIDDQTPVTFVRRQWDPVQSKVVYIIPPTAAGSPAGPQANGRIFDILGPPPIGSPVDALYPQHLTFTNVSDACQYPLNFSENVYGPGSAPGLRGATNAGSPPGNYQNGSGTGNLYTYTDLVVNIDGNMAFQSFSSNGYNFPNLATLVEAARGNLENSTVFANSLANTGVPPTITPRAGYQAEYFRLARANCHPIGDAQQAVQEFLTILNTNTDAHFCFVAFSNNAGTSASNTYPDYNIDWFYQQGGQSSFPVPLIALDRTTGHTNYAETQAVVPLTVAISGTNIGDSINTAVNQLHTNGRAGSKQAIVVFTDGEPTVGGPLDDNPWTNARRAAVAAKQAGIPIYTVGLAQNEAIVPSETAILNDTDPDPNSGGIAAIPGNGGKFFLVHRVNDLRLTFENIARQLVQLVQ